MASTINTNVASLTAQRNLASARPAQHLHPAPVVGPAHQQRQGRRRRPGDLERFTSQIRGLNQACATPTTASRWRRRRKGALKSTGDILQRVRELSVQSANATNSAGDRQGHPGRSGPAAVGNGSYLADHRVQRPEAAGWLCSPGAPSGGGECQSDHHGDYVNFRTNSYGTTASRPPTLSLPQHRL